MINRINLKSDRSITIYADYNATTPLAEGVKEAMLPYFEERFGNPSSQHYELGQIAHRSIDKARSQVAQAVDCNDEEVVFCSNGTESCFQALVGIYRACQNLKKKRLLISAVEHPAVVGAASFLVDLGGLELISLPVNSHGRALDWVRFLGEDVAAVSIMLANNETGVIFPLAEIIEGCKKSAIPVHVDATQAVGKVPFSFKQLGADIVSLSGHKFGAPKGSGVLIIGKGAAWQPVTIGGGQESGRRGGTESVALIVGLGEAASQIERRTRSYQQVEKYRDDLEQALLTQFPQAKIRGQNEARLPNTSCITLPGIDGRALVAALGKKGIAISTGSACQSGKFAPSQTLTAMGLSAAESLSTVRISLGPQTTAQEAEYLGSEICRATQQLQAEAKQVTASLLL